MLESLMNVINRSFGSPKWVKMSELYVLKWETRPLSSQCNMGDNCDSFSSQVMGAFDNIDTLNIGIYELLSQWTTEGVSLSKDEFIKQYLLPDFNGLTRVEIYKSIEKSKTYHSIIKSKEPNHQCKIITTFSVIKTILNYVEE